MLYILTAVLPLLLAFPPGSLGASITLSSADDFTNFVNDVNTGKNDYSNITIYLGSDINLLENADPIGNSTYQFLGTFDGRGHVISNLTMNTSTPYAGLFGYSDGLTIKNVILDDSCSITITHSKYDHAHVGGIIGECCSRIGECDIENCVNMAGVSFNKTISLTLYIGGVAGRLESSSIYNAHIENCVNYGSVTYSGTVSSWVDLGGIVGYGDGSSTPPYSYIQNCLNYGAITYSGKARSYFDIGGVVGNCASYAYIENCVSAGKIVTQTTISEKDHVGSIVGRVSSQAHINYCYYTSDVNASSINGTGTPNSTTGTPNSPTSVDTDLVSKLNSNATSCNWTKWLLNANNATVTFKVSNDRELSFSSQVILLIPDPVKEGNTFLFWCKDTECNNVFDPATESISGNIVLYSGWANSTVTFDFNNGTTVNATFTYNTSIEYPKDVPEKEGYTFSQWSNYHGSMPARDITVTAHWVPNNYTVTLDVNGGNELDKNETIVTFDEEYGDLPEPNRVKHTFIGWFINETDIEVTNETIVTIPRNHTLYAHWEEGPNTVPMAEIVVPAVVVVAVVVAIALIIITKKEHNKNDAIYGGYMKVNDVEDDEMLSNNLRKEYYRIIATTMVETEAKVISENSHGVLTNLYPHDYVRPSMRDALLAAGLTEEQTDFVYCACEIAAQKASENEKLFEGFTEDDAAAIAMYTYDFGPIDFESNPYRVVNRCLAGRNYRNLQNVSGLLYLVMTALRKLPRYTGRTLYRGVRSGVNLDKEHYHKGNIITWSALSSASPDVGTTKAFLARGSKSGKAVGTLFIIDGGWGYNIQSYSLFPDEVEILLEPERLFRVTDVISAEGLTIINLQMLNTPLSIPEVFGGRVY